MSEGWEHTCRLKADGSIACWGDDYKGEATPPPEIDSPPSAPGGVTAAASGTTVPLPAGATTKMSRPLRLKAGTSQSVRVYLRLAGEGRWLFILLGRVWLCSPAPGGSDDRSTYMLESPGVLSSVFRWVMMNRREILVGGGICVVVVLLALAAVALGFVLNDSEIEQEVVLMAYSAVTTDSPSGRSGRDGDAGGTRVLF